MAVLVYADSYNGQLTKNAFEAVRYASNISKIKGCDTIAVVTGKVDDSSILGNYGANKVLHASDDSLVSFDPQKITSVIDQAVSEFSADIIIFSHDYTGKSVAPRIAAKLEAGIVSGAIELPKMDGDFTVKKTVFSGKAFANIKIHTEKKVISLLPNSIPTEKTEDVAEVVAFTPSIPDTRLKVKEIKKVSSELSLTEAEKVVSGGRGLKGPENWNLIEDLAKELGAATACSRPVADTGWRPHHEHVGQTGIAIRPNLYIAAGISGAIQHLAGVNGSKTIVVINTDPEAPFFKDADYGIVGDAFEVLPRLTEAIKKNKSQLV